MNYCKKSFAYERRVTARGVEGNVAMGWPRTRCACSPMITCDTMDTGGLDQQTIDW